eukprot:TRINITY_DN5198_c0_g1_i1.p1 TRINITY_DN5198_c0_g1~~TRINITY_DN5198_c0_g1_i1.p1  ORF type:complete len:206 (-),score=19.19 TRINITY_DN5198_c0_g1_i1:295-912(-)
MVNEQSEITIADERASILPASQPPQAPLKRDCFLFFCKIVNILTALCGFLCLVAYCMAVSEGEPLTNHDAIIPQILRLYGIFFSLIIICVETEWTWLTSFFRIVEIWIFRGLIYIFFSVLALEFMKPQSTQTDFAKSLNLYRTISGFALLSCGGFYLVGGVLCFQQLKKKRHKRERERDRVLRDLDDLDRQREELLRLKSMYVAE